MIIKYCRNYVIMTLSDKKSNIVHACTWNSIYCITRKLVKS